jgi:NADH-quinone oxidoreductase subunit A
LQHAFLPIFLFVACVIALGVGLLLMAGLFNPGRSGRVTRMPYESGMDPIHDTRRRFDVRFHLLAITFLVFDVELLFLFPWAVASQTGAGKGGPATSAAASHSLSSNPELQVSPPPVAAASAGIDAAVADGAVESRHLVFGGAMTFLALLVLGFVYDWRKGVFQWR